MTDLQDVVDAVNELQGIVRENKGDEVVDAINDLKRAVASRSTFGHTLAGWAMGILMILVFASLPGDVWNNKTMLSARYNVPTEDITVEDAPRDCDFLTAPLGVKGCSYSRDISEIRTGVNPQGEHVYSTDEGKTWYVNDGSIKRSVLVTWSKK